MSNTTPMIEVTLLLFAQAREIVGISEDKLSIANADCTCKEILAQITEKYPALEPLIPSCVLSINCEYIDQEASVSLKTGDEIALIPPDIGLEEITSQIGDPGAGAISSFLGVTRNSFDSKTVTKLEYEAYVPMAEKVLHQIAEEIRRRWQVHGVALVHRLGEVPVQQASVLVAISSKHRRASLEACAFGIDAIKAYCPVWKREVYEDGSTWKENAEARALLTKGMNLAEFQSGTK